jgi:hypothetical protein
MTDPDAVSPAVQAGAKRVERPWAEAVIRRREAAVQ